jgi:hypothetical protein
VKIAAKIVGGIFALQPSAVPAHPRITEREARAIGIKQIIHCLDILYNGVRLFAQL